MNFHSFRGGTFAYRGTFHGNQFRGITTGVQSLQQEQRLILAAAPFRFQVHKQNFHDFCPRSRFLALINLPSFAYFKRTERAAILAISTPRYPSKKPPRKTKV